MNKRWAVRILLGASLLSTGPSPAAQPESRDCIDSHEARPLELRDAVIAALGQQPQLIIAREEVAKARAGVMAALTPFLPTAAASFGDERFEPNNGSAPVTVVGNTVLGGTHTYSAYGSLSLSWNLFNSGKDVAGFRGAKAELRSSEAGLDHQLNETLSQLLRAFDDLYKAQRSAIEQRRVLGLLYEIRARAEERFRNGNGTTIAIAQASDSALDAERQLYESCHAVADKSGELAKAAGIQLPIGVIFRVADPAPSMSQTDPPGTIEQVEVNDRLQHDPAVIAARENVTAAESRLRQAKAAYGPTLSLTGRRDYLGQDPNGFDEANRHLGPNSYRIGLTVQQPIFPMTAETAAIASARAELGKAQASYSQALVDATARIQTALSTFEQSAFAFDSAKRSLQETQRVLQLTESLFKAGRTDLDNLQQAQISTEKSLSLVDGLAADVRTAKWTWLRASVPAEFPTRILGALGVAP